MKTTNVDGTDTESAFRFYRKYMNEHRRGMATVGNHCTGDGRITPNSSPTFTAFKNSSHSTGKNCADSDFLTLMTKRLNKTESQLTKVQQKLVTAEKTLLVKEAKIATLTDEILKLKNHPGSETKEQICQGSTDAFPYEVNRCRQLEKQVSAMESYLMDYGLEWVGDDGSSDDSLNTPTSEGINLWCADKSVVSDTQYAIDFNRLLQNIEELNLMAGEGEAHMCYTTKGAIFKRTESVLLSLYTNGMVLFAGPFREYSDPATQLFLQDILDGYFPSELQYSYPDGVPFQVTDNHHVLYQDPRTKWKAFSGAGFRLGHRTSNIQFNESCIEANGAPTLKPNDVCQSPISCEDTTKSSEMTNSTSIDDISQDFLAGSSESKESLLILSLTHTQEPLEETVKKNNQSQLKHTPKLTKKEKGSTFIRNNINLANEQICRYQCSDVLDSDTLHLVRPQSTNQHTFERDEMSLLPKETYNMYSGLSYSGNNYTNSTNELSFTSCQDIDRSTFSVSTLFDKFSETQPSQYHSFVLPQIQGLREHRFINEISNPSSETQHTPKVPSEKSNSGNYSLPKKCKHQLVDVLNVKENVSSNHKTSCVLKGEELATVTTSVSNKIMKGQLSNLEYNISASRQNTVSQMPSLTEPYKRNIVKDLSSKDNFTNIASDLKPNPQDIKKASNQNTLRKSSLVGSHNKSCDTFKIHVKCPDPRVKVINKHLINNVEDELFPTVTTKFVNALHNSIQEYEHNSIEGKSSLLHTLSSKKPISNEKYNSDSFDSCQSDLQQPITNYTKSPTDSTSLTYADNKDSNSKQFKCKTPRIHETEDIANNFVFNDLPVAITTNQGIKSDTSLKFESKTIHYNKPLESHSEFRGFVDDVSQEEAELYCVENYLCATSLNYNESNNLLPENKNNIAPGSKANHKNLPQTSKNKSASDELNFISTQLKHVDSTVLKSEGSQNLESNPLFSYTTLHKSNIQTLKDQVSDEVTEFRIAESESKFGLQTTEKAKDKLNNNHSTQPMKKRECKVNSPSRPSSNPSHRQNTPNLKNITNLKSKIPISQHETPLQRSHLKQSQESLEAPPHTTYVHTLSMQRMNTGQEGFSRKDVLSGTSNTHCQSSIYKSTQKYVSDLGTDNSASDSHFSHKPKNFQSIQQIQSKVALPFFNKNETNTLQRRREPNTTPKTVTSKELLKKLPPVVIQNGKVIPIRSAVAEMVQIPAMIGPTTKTLISESVRQNMADIQIILKVRLWHGNEVFLVHISPDDSVGTLRQLLDKALPPSVKHRPGYHIVPGHAVAGLKSLTNNTLALKDYGLVHNTVLYLQKKK